MTLKKFPPLIDALRNPLVYNHPIKKIELVETHISWIILTGHFAYKIKKPINLGFVDFSSLDKRRYYCREELRLNRRLAPFLYLEVVSIGGSDRNPELNAKDAVIEYAVKMVQFDRDQELDKVLERGELLTTHLDRIAWDLAEFHRSAELANMESPFGTLESLRVPMMDNCSQVQDLVNDQKEKDQIDRIKEWTEASLKDHREYFLYRKQGGFIRECHGDLHLANLVLIDNRIVVFDALEFNENLRFIDIMSDLAFLLMDLDDRNHPEFANRLMNHYLMESGDYDGLKVLRTYKVYRAMVRAKVTSIRLNQSDVRSDEIKVLREAHRSYIELAEKYIGKKRNYLLLMSGFSGAGKSVTAERISQAGDAIWIRTDIERKRIANRPSESKTDSRLEEGIYTPGVTQQTYDRIGYHAESLLKEGYSVILDGTFLLRNQRMLMSNIAQKIKVPYLILNCTVPDSELRKRIVMRKEEGIDPSEADLNVLERQIIKFEPYSNEERPHVLTLNTTQLPIIQDIMSEIDRKINFFKENESSRGL
ncbi:MAG: AAA family ATPase [Nitrospiria bacterium]